MVWSQDIFKAHKILNIKILTVGLCGINIEFIGLEDLPTINLTGERTTRDVLSIFVCSKVQHTTAKEMPLRSISTVTVSESVTANAFVGISPTTCVLFKSNSAAVIGFGQFGMSVLGSIKCILVMVQGEKDMLKCKEVTISASGPSPQAP